MSRRRQACALPSAPMSFSGYSTAGAESEAPEDGRKRPPSFLWYLGAFFVPFLGIILAIVAFARAQFGPGIALLITTMLGWATAAAILASLPAS